MTSDLMQSTIQELRIIQQRFIETNVSILTKQVMEIEENKRIDVLIRDDVSYRILSEFEFIYRIIFGSQIELLYNMVGNPMSKIDISNFFSGQVIKREIPKDIIFDSWFTFLTSKDLIEKSINKENALSSLLLDTHKITDKGVAFLLFITDRGYDNKPTLI